MKIPRPAPCTGLTELFYGPDVDGRKERYRVAREQKAKTICLECSCRLHCLENALVLGEEQGVWGGMGEAERHRFRRHLNAEGYSDGEVPEGLEFWAALTAFYRAEELLMWSKYV